MPDRQVTIARPKLSLPDRQVIVAKPKLSLPDRQVNVAKQGKFHCRTILELHQKFSGVSIAQIYMYNIHVWNLKRILKGYNETEHKTT